MCFKLPRRVGAAFMPFWFATLLSGVAMPYWCHAEPSDIENTTAHFQSTCVWQRKPAFPATYSGTNSLSPELEKRSRTLSATGSLDYQHIANPAYNADRGPVQIYSARLHFEY